MGKRNRQLLEKTKTGFDGFIGTGKSQLIFGLCYINVSFVLTVYLVGFQFAVVVSRISVLSIA